MPLAAGCLGSGGGGGGGVPSPKAKLPAGARVAPASARVFVALNTDSRSPGWGRRAELYRRFAGFGVLPRTLSHGQKGLGNELDLVLLDFKGGGNDVVGLARPTSKAKFKALFQPRGVGPRTVTAELNGWTIFADSRGLLDRFVREAHAGKLVDEEAFRDEMSRVSATNAVRIYVKGDPVQKALDRWLSRQSAPPLLSEEVGTLVGMAFGVSAEPAGTRLEGVARVTGDVRANAYTAKLPQETPAGALLYVSFNHLDLVLKKTLKVVSAQNPPFEQQLSQVTALMDITLNHDIYPVLSHEGALAIYEASPGPTIVFLLSLKDEARAKGVLGRVVTIARLSGRAVKTRRLDVSGVRVDELDFSRGRTRVFAAVVGGKLMVANNERMIEKLIGGKGAKLADDRSFRNVLKASKMPQRTLGFVYAKPGKLMAAVAPWLGHAPLPSSTSGTAPPAIAYVTRDGDRYAVTGFLAIK